MSRPPSIAGLRAGPALASILGMRTALVISLTFAAAVSGCGQSLTQNMTGTGGTGTGTGGLAASGGTGGTTLGTGGGSGGSTSAVCDMLSASYQAAFSSAETCEVGASGQCQQLYRGSLTGCSCPIYVNDSSALDAIQAAWQAAGCVVPQPPCAILCPAALNTTCVATDGGTVGTCSYVQGTGGIRGGTGGDGGLGGTTGAAGASGGAGGRSGRGGAGGRAGAGGAGGSGAVCGGIAGLTCTGLYQFCHFPDGQCGAGDQQGQCELYGGADCIQQAVCGCDGKTYSSACSAAANGTDVMATTSCIPGNGGAGAPCGQDSDCMSGYKCCVTGGTAGAPIACRNVGTGSCPALP